MVWNRKKYEEENKERIRERRKRYRQKNKKRIKLSDKQYYLKNRERLCNQKKEYYKKNKFKRNKRKGENTTIRRRKDKNFAISLRLRSLLFYALQNYGNGKQFFSKKYGIDYKKIIEHLKPFPEDISKYHIDHIKPLCSFDLTNSEEILKAFAPGNHQWLSEKEHLEKSISELRKARTDVNI